LRSEVPRHGCSARIDRSGRPYADYAGQSISREYVTAVEMELDLVCQGFLQDEIDGVVAQSGTELFALIAGRELDGKARRHRRPVPGLSFLKEVVFDGEIHVTITEGG